MSTVSAANLHQPPTSVEEILAHLFRPMGVDGVFGRTGAYEDVVDALGLFITRLRPKSAEVFRFPPVVSRALIEKSGYLKSFPNLLGCVCALQGDEASVEAAINPLDAGGSWTDSVEPIDLVLAPAVGGETPRLFSHRLIFVFAFHSCSYLVDIHSHREQQTRRLAKRIVFSFLARAEIE